MGLADWLEWWRERPRQQMVKRFARKHPRLVRPPSEMQRRLDVLETLRQWEVIDDEEYRRQLREVAVIRILEPDKDRWQSAEGNDSPGTGRPAPPGPPPKVLEIRRRSETGPHRRSDVPHLERVADDEDLRLGG